MKTMKKRTITILLSLLMITAGTSLFAQRGRGLGPCGMGYGFAWDTTKSDFQHPVKGFGQFGMGHGMMRNNYCPLPDLTDDQAEQIKELRLAHYKEVQPLRAQMSELAVKHRNLVRAEKPDIKAINAGIDERTDVMNKLMKKQAEFRTEFRNLLTDEQKMKLDNSGRGFGMRKGMRHFGSRGKGFHGGGFNKW